MQQQIYGQHRQQITNNTIRITVLSALPPAMKKLFRYSNKFYYKLIIEFLSQYLVSVVPRKDLIQFKQVRKFSKTLNLDNNLFNAYKTAILKLCRFLNSKLYIDESRHYSFYIILHSISFDFKYFCRRKYS